MSRGLQQNDSNDKKYFVLINVYHSKIHITNEYKKLKNVPNLMQSIMLNRHETPSTLAPNKHCNERIKLNQHMETTN